MTKIILARHGKYFNPQAIIPFRSNDVHLSVEGIEQIEQNAGKLRGLNISQIYSSPIARCAESADIFSKILKVGINFEDDLVEIGSPFQNIPEAEYHRLHSEISIYADQYHTSHGGETIEQVHERLDRFITKVLKECKDQNILVVSHGDPIMLLVMKVQNLFFDINKTLESQTNYIKKGGMIELEFDGEKFIKFKNLNF